jgi:methylthioribose-1-phosphate isomerase
MNKNREIILKILEESIKLEKSIGNLYMLFHTYYTEDKTFWYRMATDEQKHATIIEGLRPWINLGARIDDFLLDDLQELKDKNSAIEAIIEKAEEEKPTRETAFNLAYRIEVTASEIHYQKIMTEQTDNKLLVAMQELCNADKDHQKRIRKMMDTIGIKLIKDK